MTLHLLDTIRTVADRVRREEDREALRCQLRLIRRQSREALPLEEDRQQVRERFQAAMRAPHL